MKKYILLFLLLLSLSFICNYYLEKRLRFVFSEIRVENIKDLESVSNKNFYKYGIENIGENLQKELMKMNVDQGSFNVRKDYFYFFQNKIIYVTDHKKCLKVTVRYNLIESLFKIKGFQNCR